jgi:RNA polymerase sigma-70 factor (ECF subfamily)
MDGLLASHRVAQKLFEQHGAAIYRFALMMLRRAEDAEDVVQETFLKLLLHLDRPGDDANVRGWLFTVAAHAAKDRLRRRFRWVPWSLAPEPTTEPELLPDEDGRRRSARDALLGLPRRDRLLLSLRASGLSYHEIAAAAAVRPASVGRLLARALQRHRAAVQAAERAGGLPATARAAGSPRDVRKEWS